MATRSPHLQIIDYLRESGARVREVTQEGKHPKIHFTYKGVDKYLVTSLTPSDWRSFEHQKKDVRHLLAEIDLIRPDFRDAEVIVDNRARRLPALDTIGRRLQYAREQQQLSRTKLSETAQVPIDIIEDVETVPHAQLNWLAALKLSTALGLSLSYLMGEQEGEHPMSTLGERVRDQRTKKNLTVGMLANTTGIPVQQLANLESGDLQNFYRLDEVAKALDCSKDYLLTGETEEEEEFTGSVTTREEMAAMFRYYREKAGISQGELARRLGTSQAYVSRWERLGAYTGNVVEQLGRYQEILQIPDEIIKGIPSEFLHEKVRGSGSPAYVKAVRQKPAKPEPIEKLIEFQAVDTENLLEAIREEGQRTRELLQAQHEALITTLRSLPGGDGVATTLHTLIDNLFKPKG